MLNTIHKGGLKIALVVDDNDKLLGTVTDGDIRRTLLKTSNQINVNSIMNSKPITIKENTKLSKVIEIMKKIISFTFL